MAVGQRAREVFQRIGETESVARPPLASFQESIAMLERLITRRAALFPDRRFGSAEEEFVAHERLYAQARARGLYRD